MNERGRESATLPHFGGPPEARGRVVLAVSAVMVAGATLALVVAHVGTRFQMDHASGVWLAHSLEARDGTLYPALFDGDSFGGTRYMPLSIALGGGVMHVISDPLLAGKVLGGLSFLALMSVTVMVLLRLGVPRLHALALVLLLPITDVGLQAVSGIRYDSVPAALQLMAAALFMWGTGRRALVAAALCCALALLAKLSAVWAPVAIGLCLWRSDRRSAIWFLAVHAALVAALFGMFNLASGGRLAENMAMLSGAGMERSPSLFFRAPMRMVRDIVDQAQAVWALTGFTVLGVALAVTGRNVTVFHAGVVIAGGITALTYMDSGVQGNHLVDLLVLSIVVVGHLLASLRPSAEAGGWVRGATSVVLSTVLVTSWIAGPARDGIDAARSRLGGPTPDSWSAKPLTGFIRPSTSLFSDDPYVSIAHGKKPVVGDAFMLLRLLRDNPAWRAALVSRIENKEFDLVVLTDDPHDPGGFYEDGNLGPDVIAAIDDAYTFHLFKDNYWVYVPQRDKPMGSGGSAGIPLPRK